MHVKVDDPDLLIVLMMVGVVAMMMIIDSNIVGKTFPCTPPAYTSSHEQEVFGTFKSRIQMAQLPELLIYDAHPHI